MTARRPVSWFLTERGRNFSFGVLAAAGVSFTSVNFLPHTMLLYKYKEFVHLYKDSREVPLSKELEEKYNKCLEILKVSDVHRKLLTPFSVFGYDLFHAGSCASKFGAAIGIPVHFSYKSNEDVERQNIQVNQNKVDWESETGKKLLDALKLSDDVQIFGICREILTTQNNKVFIQSGYPIICITLAYSLSQNLNKRMNLYAAPLVVRTALYMMTGLFSLGLYFFMKDFTEVYYETNVDKKLVELGPEFIQSGITFYDKILKRNQALRELMGREGERKYSKLGSENFFIRQPRLALVHRKQFFEMKLKELTESQEKNKNTL